jgi:DNA-directed RNA polymerase specialized sigma24 family protein
MDRIEAGGPRADRGAYGSPSFEDFYRAQLGRLVVLARGVCSPSVAEDVAQESMWAEAFLASVRFPSDRPSGRPS